MAIAFKRQSLSQKEQDAKNRFYGVQNQKNSPPTRDIQNEAKKQSQQSQNQFQAAYNAPSDKQIDQFYKNLEQDFKQVAQKQVTMGMLTNQQEMMKQQQEILLKNQEQMKQFTQNNNQPQSNIQVNQEQQTMMNLLLPINQQLQEIKQLYQQTQQSQTEIRAQINQQNSNINLKQFDTQNNQLKQLLETTQNNLQFLRPENLQTLQNFTNFNLQLYQDTISNLQNQINALQNDAYTSEQELHIKYKQLNDAHMVRKIQKVAQYEEETVQQLEKQINQISFDKSQEYLNQKLGGFFDYDKLNEDITELSDSAQNIYSKYIEQGLDFEMFIPEFSFNTSDLDALNNKQTSILDEMKAVLGISNKPIQQPQFIQKQQLPTPTKIYIQQQNEKQKNTIKPTHLINIPTKPIEPPKDIKFQKQQTTQNYQPIFKEPPKQTSDKKPKSQKVINQDKLEYRKPQNKTEQKNYGVIQYLDNDKSYEEPKYEITYNKKNLSDKKITNSDIIKLSQQDKPQNSQIQDITNNVEINKPEDYQNIYNYQDVKSNYQDTINEHKFINYDELLNEVQQTNNYQSQEQKSGALLERLGLKQENPKNEYELVELLSRDIIKDKLVQHKQLNLQAKEMMQNEKILKNQSIQIQPETPNLQDQIATGAQAFFQGLLTAFNTTLNQVNDGLSGNAIKQAKQLVAIQQQLESSNYTDTEEEELKQQQQYKIKQEKLLEQKNQQNIPNKQTPFQNTQVLQQYTFASTFAQQQQQQQQKETQPLKPVNEKDYFKKFEISEGSFVSDNRSGASYAGSIFRFDDSYGHKSEGQVSITDGKNTKRSQVTKDIFQGLNQDLSDSEIPKNKKK